MRDRESPGEEGEKTPPPPPPPPETPIEREIRLGVEREQVLRRERGISRRGGQPEYVEVRRKPAPAPEGPPAAGGGKERHLAGAQMQRDILQESRREQDLVQRGQVTGAYDRGHRGELQERKMIFETMGTVSSDPPTLKRQSTPSHPVTPVPVAPAVPRPGGKKGPSFAEANGSNIILIEHSSLLRGSSPAEHRVPTPAQLRGPAPADPRGPAPAEPPRPTPGSPFLRLRSPSPRSLLEMEIEEAEEREHELRRQRSSVYGREDGPPRATRKTPESRGDIQSGPYQPERPSWRRLEVNWPPSQEVTMNGQQADQGTDNPRGPRQRSSLFQGWESGSPNPLDEN